MRKKQVYVEFEGGRIELTFLSEGNDTEEVNGLGNEANPGSGLGHQGNPGGRLQVGKLTATVSTTEITSAEAASLESPSVSVILKNRKEMLG